MEHCCCSTDKAIKSVKSRASCLPTARGRGHLSCLLSHLKTCYPSNAFRVPWAGHAEVSTKCFQNSDNNIGAKSAESSFLETKVIRPNLEIWMKILNATSSFKLLQWFPKCVSQGTAWHRSMVNGFSVPRTLKYVYSVHIP